MYKALLITFFTIDTILIAIIILYQNGADASSSFGVENGGILFNSNHSGSYINRITTILAVLFFGISLILGNINSNKNKEVNKQKNLEEKVKIEKIQSTTLDRSTNDIPR